MNPLRAWRASARWRDTRRRASRGIIWVAALAATAVAVPAQTFVAEWAEADIDRLGPTGMALDTVGGATYLYVADQNHGRIIKINLADGSRVAVWGTNGTDDGQFNSPFGIAIEPATHDLYIAERGNNRVQRLTSNGAFVMKWGALGTAPDQFSSPVGIAADAAGNVYVVDHDNNRVLKFHVSSSGGGWRADPVTAWGSKGSGNGQFNAPYGITLDATGHLWVADAQNHRLQKFDTSGNFLASIGSFGTGNGQFVTPTWVNFDAAGNYYVAETNSDPENAAATDIQNQRVQKFSPSGAFVLKWGSYGETGGQFRLPFDVVVDAANNAYVADYYNTRVQKFSLSSVPPPPPPPAAGGARFVNLSSRLRTVDGDTNRALIAGFAVTGTAPKQMLVRAIGPGLAQFGVANPLPNPRLRVYSGTTVVADNDDWGNDAAITDAGNRVGAFALAPNSRDAALLVTLPPGVYSAQVAANGGDGVALVEVYDAASTQPTAELVNLSTRGFVDTGDGVLVAGFVVSGSTPKRVLVRGIGPALAAFGVPGPLADTTVKVFSGSTLIAQNDDWGAPLPVAGGPAPVTAAEVSAAAQTAGAFTLASGSKDSALVVTLSPGNYSAVVSGANNSTGAGLVEVYELPSQ